LKGKWKAANVDKSWKESSFAQNRDKSSKRRALNDFERFKVLRLRKQARTEERRALSKVKASS
jgi:large subunit ribosomal protein L14e